jgi:hypothetical protein
VRRESIIQAYKATQKLEKDKLDAASESVSGDETHHDFVASSAPFPDPQKPHMAKGYSESSTASSTSDSQSETGPSMGDE